MKTQTELLTALEVKSKQLSDIRIKLSELQIWIDAGFIGKNESFVSSVFQEKLLRLDNEKRILNQIEILQWILNEK